MYSHSPQISSFVSEPTRGMLMREVERPPLIRASRSRTRRRFIGRVALALCFLSVIAIIGLLSEPDLRVDAAPVRPAETSMAPVTGALLGDSSNSPHSADGLWRTSDESRGDRNTPHIDAGPRFVRTLSLNEKEQRKLLSRAPMEFTRAARQAQVVMELPMPDGTFWRFDIE